MPDSALEVAFSGAAPEGERVSAMEVLQKAHMPTSTVDQSAMNELVDFMRNQYEWAALEKAINPNLVPYPSNASKEGKRGMQSVDVDDFSLMISGDFIERPSLLGFDSLRAMVEQTPVLNAVIMTRIRQMQRFCKIAESGNDVPGFEIRHVDRTHQLSPTEKESIALLAQFMQNCGWEFSPRRRRALRRDSLSQFVAKSVRDSLTMDSAPIETEWKVNKELGFDGFYAVDGSTIRLCTEQGYRGDDEIFALQVVAGRVSTAYTFEDLIYEPRNPRADVRAAGYGLSETELLVKVVTGFLNAMTYNVSGFDRNAIPKGILHLSGNYSPQDIDSFKRFWNATVRGVNNAWALPVMVSKDQASKAEFQSITQQFDEMHFSKWMTFLTSVICAIYGMSPAEINFDSFTAGSTSALAGSDTGEKLAASKDSGLVPLLAYYENLFSDFIIREFSDRYVFRWTGIEPEDRQQKLDIRKTVLTLNEMRAEEGYTALEGPMGECPVNPSLTGIWMQIQQGQQQGQGGDFGQGGAQPGEGAPPGAAPGDDGAQGDAGDGAGGDPQDFGLPAQGDFGDDGAAATGAAGDDGGAPPDFGQPQDGDFGKSMPLIYEVSL